MSEHQMKTVHSALTNFASTTLSHFVLLISDQIRSAIVLNRIISMQLFVDTLLNASEAIPHNYKLFA